MGIYRDWIQMAYDERGGLIKKNWDVYLPLEQAIYENMLATKNNVIKGVFSELAESYNMSLEFMAGFLDGISGALDNPPDMDEIDANSEIDVKVDFAALYKKMVELKANHLAALPEWDNIFSVDERKNMYKEQKASGTVIRGEKTGRNEPCPCESGKKFKKCCG
jgi:hypothetical protein